MKNEKGLLSVLMLLALALSFLPVMEAVASTVSMPETTVTIDLTTISGENSNYKVEDNRIVLYNRDVTYVLSGETTKDIFFSNNPNDYTSKTFYLRLNGAKFKILKNGNYKYWNVVVDVAENTTNNVEYMTPKDLTIQGKGTLNAKFIDNLDNGSLSITDTTIHMNPATNGVEWQGTVALGGTANVTIKGNGAYSPLKIGQREKSTLTLNNSAKLYVLQDDMDEPSIYVVDGIELFKGSEIILNDSSYLEVEGKNSQNADYAGYAIIGYDSQNGKELFGDITINNSATLKATAYGTSVYGGNISINGGNVIAESKKVGCAIYAGNTISIKNSNVHAKATDPYYSIFANTGTISVKNSWLEAGKYMPNSSVVENSVVFKSNEGTVIGHAELNADATVTQNMKLVIPVGTSLTVPSGKTFTNNGDIIFEGSGESKGKFIKETGSTIICNRHSLDTGKNDTHYWQKCLICDHEMYNKQIPSITITGSDTVCRTQDYTFTVMLPAGTSLADDSSYTFDDTTQGESISSANNTFTVTIPASEYNEHKAISLSIYATTEEQFSVSATKTVNISDHFGGTATCKDKTVCEACGQPYGELNPKNHTDLQHFEAHEATTEATGNIEYWFCNGCKKYFSDSEGKNEISFADTMIAKLTKAESGDTKPPQTGDDSHAALWFALLLASGAALTLAGFHAKKKHSAK